MTDKELIKWLKDKIIYFSNEESKTENDYWKGKCVGTREAYELILKMLEIMNYTSAGVNTNALPYKIAILDDYGNSASVNANFLPYKITVSDDYGVIGEYVIPTGMRGDTVNLCDDCKFTDDCNPTLTGRVGARTTECSKYKKMESKVDPVEDNQWIPVKTRPLTEEEKEIYPDYTFIYDCRMPEDGEEVLVTTKYGVYSDRYYRDDCGCYFEDHYDDGEVLAWKPLPEPYKEGDTE